MIVDELARIPMSPFLKATLVRAAEYAQAQSHREVTLEHLLLALAEDPEASVVLKLSNVDIDRLMSDISSGLGRLEDRGDSTPGEVTGAISADLRRILEAAAAAAQQGRRREINGAIVLAAIVGDGKTASAHMLRAQGLTFEEAIRALQRMANSPLPPADPAPAALPPPETARQEPLPPGAPPAADAPHTAQEHAPSPAAVIPSPRPTLEPEATGGGTAVTPGAVASPRPQPAAEAAARRAPAPAPQPARKELSLDEAVASIRRDRTEAAPAPSSTIAPNWQPAHPAQQSMPAPRPAPHQPIPQSPPPGGSWAPAGQPAPAPAPPPRSGRPPPPMQPAAGPGPRPPLPVGTAFPGPAGAPPQRDMAGTTGPRAPTTPPWPGGGGDPRLQPYDEAMARLDARRPPAQGAHPATRAKPVSMGGVQRPAVEPGQLHESIPRKMRVGVPVIAEVLIARADVKNLSDRMQSGGAAYRHEVSITRAMTVRLRAPDGGFSIETTSPETQWIENILNLAEGDSARWRWVITARERGKKRLQLVVSARTVDGDGLTAETALPDKVIEVRVSINYGQTALKWAGWLTAAVLGGLLARFGEGTFDMIRSLITRANGG